MSNRETKFTTSSPKVQEVVRALMKFPQDAECVVMRGDKKFDLTNVFDNAKWGNDNEVAIIEITERRHNV